MLRSEFDTRAAGTWDETAQTRTTTVCAHRAVGRDLTQHVQDNEIVEVTSPHDNPVTPRQPLHQGPFRPPARTEPGLMRTWDESRNDAR